GCQHSPLTFQPAHARPTNHRAESHELKICTPYTLVPESLLTGKVLALCGTCGLPALSGDKPQAANGRWCEGEDCPPGIPFRLARDPGHTLVLRRCLRAFLTLSGPTEKAALDKLSGAGIGYDFIPADLGTYRIHDAGARTCFMRVYDRQEPTVLAARVANSFVDLAGLAWVVVPQRLANRAGYRAAFETALGDGPRERVALTTPDDLVCRVRAQHTSRKNTEQDDA
ncbi:hypothetical protein AB0I22_36200, partial [Streptomyces sp. NPDC050610]|uniref:hypothetical protein n=1 Tax=Streptomyces sp. NPDC050610 TaxID=3157097 RepID=UPI00341A19AC